MGAGPSLSGMIEVLSRNLYYPAMWWWKRELLGRSQWEAPEVLRRRQWLGVRKACHSLGADARVTEPSY